MVQPENMEAETLQATDRAPTPQKFRDSPKGSGGRPCKGERAGTGNYNGHTERTTIGGGEATQISKDHAPPSREGLEDRTP